MNTSKHTQFYILRNLDWYRLVIDAQSTGMLLSITTEKRGGEKGVMNASPIRNGCCGVVQLTNPAVPVETGLMYLLSI